MNIQTDTRLQERLNAALQKGDTTEIGLVIQQMNLDHVRQYAQQAAEVRPLSLVLTPLDVCGQRLLPARPHLRRLI